MDGRAIEGGSTVGKTAFFLDFLFYGFDVVVGFDKDVEDFCGVQDSDVDLHLVLWTTKNKQTRK